MRALLLLQLRTGWKGLAGWALAWTCLVLAVAASTLSLYPGGEERERYAASLGASRMQEAFNGRGYELRTAGGILSVEVGMFGLLALSLGACLMAVGRTRREEAEGRWDIVASASRGRTAPMRAAVAAVALSLLPFGAATAVGLVALGLPAGGSLAYAGSLVCYAMVFAALGFLAAQIAPDARTAAATAVSATLGCYLLRALVDGRHWPATWATPMGWLAETRPWGAIRWWTFLAFALTAALLMAAALLLASRRDLGGSAMGMRSGPARAPAWLSGPWAWTWRTARAPILAWALGAVVLASVMASMGEEIRLEVAANPSLVAVMGGQDPADFLTALAMTLLALFSLAAGMAVWSRYRDEEAAGRLGLVASAPVSRKRLWGTWLAWSCLAASGVMLAGAVVYAAVLTRVSDRTGPGSILLAGAADVVAVLVVIAGAGVLVAARPGLGRVAWIPCAWVGVVGMLADVLRLPEWARRLSPVQAVGRAPVESPRWAAVGAFAFAALALALVGGRLSDRRDLAAG